MGVILSGHFMSYLTSNVCAFTEKFYILWVVVHRNHLLCHHFFTKSGISQNEEQWYFRKKLKHHLFLSSVQKAFQVSFSYYVLHIRTSTFSGTGKVWSSVKLQILINARQGLDSRWTPFTYSYRRWIGTVSNLFTNHELLLAISKHIRPRQLQTWLSRGVHVRCLVRCLFFYGI